MWNGGRKHIGFIYKKDVNEGLRSGESVAYVC